LEISMSLAAAACPCRAHSFATFATAVAGTLAAVAMVLGCAPSPASPPAPIAMPPALAAPATRIARMPYRAVYRVDVDSAPQRHAASILMPH
jgi:hypothetical protein